MPLLQPCRGSTSVATPYPKANFLGCTDILEVDASLESEGLLPDFTGTVTDSFLSPLAEGHRETKTIPTSLLAEACEEAGTV